MKPSRVIIFGSAFNNQNRKDCNRSVKTMKATKTPEATAKKRKVAGNLVPKATDTVAANSERIVRGAHVQYLGDITAYHGQRGEVQDIMGEKASVLFMGANIPIAMPVNELTVIDDNQADHSALMTSSKPRFRYVANTSGGILCIPDLRNEVEPEGIGLEAGEKIDLLTMFTPQQINRSRGLQNSVKKISDQSGLPLITVLESLDDPLPEGTFIKPLAETVTPGTRLQADDNIFDDKLDHAYEKEEEQAEKARGASHLRRKTRQHGRASKTLGKG